MHKHVYQYTKGAEKNIIPNIVKNGQQVFNLIYVLKWIEDMNTTRKTVSTHFVKRDSNHNQLPKVYINLVDTKLFPVLCGLSCNTKGKPFNLWLFWSWPSERTIWIWRDDENKNFVAHANSESLLHSIYLKCDYAFVGSKMTSGNLRK